MPDPDLIQLHHDVDRRVAQTTAGRRWPCRRGGDACCRSLARPMALPEAEWRRLMEGLATLPPDLQAQIRQAALALADHPGGQPVQCPFLDEAQGACRVYPWRPAACRAYGAYRGRRYDAFCGQVEDALPALEAEQPTPIIWGNQDALNSTLRQRFGPEIDIADWFRATPDPM